MLRGENFRGDAVALEPRARLGGKPGGAPAAANDEHLRWFFQNIEHLPHREANRDRLVSLRAGCTWNRAWVRAGMHSHNTSESVGVKSGERKERPRGCLARSLRGWLG